MKKEKKSKEVKVKKEKPEKVVKNKTPLTKEEIERIRESEVGRVVKKSSLLI